MLIDKEGRSGSCGVWHDATDTDGTRRGAMRVEPELLGAAGALQRLVACIGELRSANLDCLLPITDLVRRPGETGEEIWLITGAPANPTLAGREPGREASTAVLDAGRGLLALHAIGRAHGALSASSVVLHPSGRGARLVDVGVRAALTGSTPDHASDVRQWALLSRTFATTDDPLLPRCADLAEEESLAAAVAALEAGLAEPEPGLEASAASTGGAGADRTILGRRGAKPPAPIGASETDVIRFGPGVPRDGAIPAATIHAVGRKRRRRRRRWVSAVITVAVVAGVAWWWWDRLGGLAVKSASVSAPSAVGCATTVDVVGTIATNGRRGVIRYRWLRNDGHVSAELSQPMARGEHSVGLHLAWTFAGHGSFAAVATLEVLSPAPLRATGRFSYQCA